MGFIDKIKLLSQQEHNRVLMGNFFYLSILKLVSFLFPLITLPYLSRVIGVERFGAIAFATAIVVVIETVVNWGFDYTATRDVARCREQVDRVSQIFSEVLFARLVLTLLCFVALGVCLLTIPALAEYRLLLLLTFAYIPGHILFPEWFFQAYERMQYITLLNLLSKLLFTLLVFVVIREQSDYIYQPLLIACGYMVSGVVAMWVIVKRFEVRIVIPRISSMWQRLKASANMFVTLIVPNLYNNFSVVLLRACCGDRSVGVYSGGEKFHSIVDQLAQVLTRTFFPFLARNKEKHVVYVRIAGTISLAMCAVMFFGADLFVKLFLSPEFEQSAQVIRILSLCPFFLFLANAYGTNYLVLIGKERVLRNIYVICSLAGFGLAWVLVPRYGFVGIAVLLLVVRAAIGISTYCMNRHYNLNLSGDAL